MKGYKKNYGYVWNDKLLQRYFHKRDLSWNSRIAYTYKMEMYLHVTGLTPSKAIEEADEDEDKGIRLKRRRIFQHLNDFEDFLEDEGYGENTILTSIAFVKSFYRFYDITELPQSKRKKRTNQYAFDVTQLPGTDHIKKAISHSNVKYQAIIVLLASTGMRQGDLRNLRIKQFIQSINNYIEEEHAKIRFGDLDDIESLRNKIPKNIGPLRWDFCMQKGRRKHATFSTPESLEFLLTYLEKRPEITSMNDYIFPGQCNGELRIQSLNHYFERLDEKCNFPKKKPIYFRPQNLRKWFANQLKKTELGYTETRLLMGHRVMDDTGSRYLVPDFEDLYQKYYRNLDAVTIFNKVEVHDLTDSEIAKIRQENQERDELREKELLEMEEMKKTLAEIQRDFMTIINNPEAIERFKKNLK